jgi:predicted dehydrogenase
MDRVRIGVIGLGFGQQHVRSLANLAEADLVAVADRRLDGLESFAARYGARAYRDGVEMLERETLDAVSVCTGPQSRAPVIEAAARQRVALFIEKPWAANLEQARDLARLCRDTDAAVMTAFSFRFHPVVARLRELMDGELGPGWLMSGEYVFGWVPSPDAWLWKPESGGGFFNENSCHLFDVVCHLLGEPVSVAAGATAPQGTPSENAGALVVRFAGGALASLIVGGVGAGGFHDYPRMNVITANGQAHLLGRDHIYERLRWTVRGSDAVQEIVRPPEALGETRYSHAFRHLFDCVRTGKRPAATVEDGVRSVALAAALYESVRTGQTVPVSGGTIQEG